MMARDHARSLSQHVCANDIVIREGAQSTAQRCHAEAYTEGQLEDSSRAMTRGRTQRPQGVARQINSRSVRQALDMPILQQQTLTVGAPAKRQDEAMTREHRQQGSC